MNSSNTAATLGNDVQAMLNDELENQKKLIELS